MPVHSAQIRVSTEGNGDIIDITRGVAGGRRDQPASATAS